MVKLGEALDPENHEFRSVMTRTYQHNPWFTEENILLAIDSIRTRFLDPEILTDWTSGYDIKEDNDPKTVGLVFAGNIPLVGFHDFLTVFLSGNSAIIKLSEKDQFLMPFIFKQLESIDAPLIDSFRFEEKLSGFDAVIATGSNNTSRYFEYYFGKYPNIIRKNRTSVAVLDGTESENDLSELAKDVFRYFGLGCRNVSKVYVPEDYDFEPLLLNFQRYENMLMHNKYKNNYDYNLTLLILNKIPYLSCNALLIHENASIHSRIASLHYEKYSNETDLKKKLGSNLNEIQCIIRNKELEGFKITAAGKAQEPEIWDYADDVDTMEFLLALAVESK